MKLLLAALALSFSLSALARETDPKSIFDQVSTEIRQHQAELLGYDFYYYTQADRLKAINQFLDAVELEYAALPYKIKTLQISLNGLRKAAVEAEAAIPDTDVKIEQAKSNMDFLDRGRKLVANFQDTHFDLYPSLGTNAYFLGFTIGKMEDKYVIAGLFQKLLGYSKRYTTQLDRIKNGQEVVAIDGVPVADAVKALEPYISSSSTTARELLAIDALTVRSFSIPQKNYAVVTIKDENGNEASYRIPWFTAKGARVDQDLLIKEGDFRTFNELLLTWDKEKKKWINEGDSSDLGDGFSEIIPLMDEEIFYNSDKDEVIKAGFQVDSGKSYVIAKINSFEYPDLQDKDGQAITFAKAVGHIARMAEGSGSPVILDLRNNPGGQQSLAAQLLAAFTEKDKIYPGPVMGYRVTRTTQLISEFDQGTIRPGLSLNLPGDQIYDLFKEAVANKSVYTAAVSNGDIVADPEVGGFSQKMAVLTSPFCISTCDIAALLFKTSGRAIIVGMPTNGTGDGFSGGEALTKWSDSYRIFSSQIPNHLFGRPGGEAGEYIFRDKLEALTSENRPTMPDVAHAPTMDDLNSKGIAWLQEGINALNAPPPAPAPTIGGALDKAVDFLQKFF